jgi:hypothetical protein
MENLKLNQSDNLSGIVSIDAIPFMYASYIPNAVEGFINEADIVLIAGASFSTIEFQRNSAQESVEQVDTNGGSLFNYSLVARYPKDTPSATIIINEFCLKPLILKAIDTNGIKKLIGSIINPAKCKYKVPKSGNASGFNGYEFTFTWQSIEYPAYLQ